MGELLRIFALGGNEISPTGQVDPKTGKLLVPNLDEQWRRTFKTCSFLANIIEKNPEHQYLLTHGNGPQVGNILMRSEFAQKILHPIPLDVCVADSQGGIGYMLAMLTNILRVKGIDKIAAEILTQVVVDPKDVAFQNPSKFIGKGYSKEDALKKEREDGWDVKKYKNDINGNEVWRRVVPSPDPKAVVELEMIESLLKTGMVPIAVGGGGIPVRRVDIERNDGEIIYKLKYGVEIKTKHNAGVKIAEVYSGIEAVIDKDLASALLGTLLIDRARKRGEDFESEFVIFTDEDGAKLNYQKPNQVDLRELKVSQAQKYIAEGVFADGSMKPKIQACVDFVNGGGRKAYITKVDLFEKTVEGIAGTVIIPD